MPLRDYIFENLGWKLAALLLAVLVWFSIQFAIRKGGDSGVRTLRNQPVHILTASGDARIFNIQPLEVDVLLRPRSGPIKNLSDQEVQVFVNLTDIPDVTGPMREVLVYTKGQFEVLRTEPKVVYVERIGGPKDTLTNRVTKP